MTFPRPKLLLPLLAALALTAVSGNATVIGYTYTLLPATTEVDYTLTLPKFAGTGLQSVVLYFRAYEDFTTFTVTNNASSTQNFNLSVTANMVLGSDNSANSADAFTGENLQVFDTHIGSARGNCTDTPSSNVLPNNGCHQLTLASHASADYAPFTIANTDSRYGLSTGTGIEGVFGVIKTAADPSAYEGSPGDTFSITGSTLNLVTFQGGGLNQTLHNITSAGFQVEVDYTYNGADPPSPTPEPATMGLLGSALAGLVVFRKRFVR
jgi:hypothetical protein